MSTVRRTAGWGGVLALALLFPLGAIAVGSEAAAAVAHHGAATVDRLGPRTPTVVSAHSRRERMLTSRFATATLAAGVVLLGLALGEAVSRRNHGAPHVAGRSRAPPPLRFG